MAEPRFDLELPIGDVARALGIRAITINMWRHRGLLPELGEYQGEKKARRYGFREIVALEITRSLSTELPFMLAGSAAAVAMQCAGELLMYNGRIPPGSLFVVEPGNMQAASKLVLADELSERLKAWATQHNRTRLELIDLRQVALRVGAKLARYQDKRLRDEYSEKEVMELIEPFFQDRIAEYLKGEREKQDRAIAEKMKA